MAWRRVGQGRPIVLLHGLFSDAHMNWIKFGHAERIAAESLRVIMPDLRAHGLSGKPHDPANYPQMVLVRDLKELIAHLGLDDFDLGGFSLGARTVIEAVIGGVRPRRAILSGTGPRGPHQLERRRDFYIDAIDKFGEASHGDPHWFAIQFMKTMKVDREAARLLLGTMRDREDKHEMVDAFTMPTLVVLRRTGRRQWLGGRAGSHPSQRRICRDPGTHMSSSPRPEFGERSRVFRRLTP